MINPADFHTHIFQTYALKLRAEVDKLKDDAVARPQQEPHEHPYRVGRIKGLEMAAELLREVEREALHLEKSTKS